MRLQAVGRRQANPYDEAVPLIAPVLPFVTVCVSENNLKTRKAPQRTLQATMIFRPRDKGPLCGLTAPHRPQTS